MYWSLLRVKLDHLGRRAYEIYCQFIGSPHIFHPKIQLIVSTSLHSIILQVGWYIISPVQLEI